MLWQRKREYIYDERDDMIGERVVKSERVYDWVRYRQEEVLKGGEGYYLLSCLQTRTQKVSELACSPVCPVVDQTCW